MWLRAFMYEIWPECAIFQQQYLLQLSLMLLAFKYRFVA